MTVNESCIDHALERDTWLAPAPELPDDPNANKLWTELALAVAVGTIPGTLWVWYANAGPDEFFLAPSLRNLAYATFRFFASYYYTKHFLRTMRQNAIDVVQGVRSELQIVNEPLETLARGVSITTEAGAYVTGLFCGYALMGAPNPLGSIIPNLTTIPFGLALAETDARHKHFEHCEHVKYTVCDVVARLGRSVGF